MSSGLAWVVCTSTARVLGPFTSRAGGTENST